MDCTPDGTIGIRRIMKGKQAALRAFHGSKHVQKRHFVVILHYACPADAGLDHDDARILKLAEQPSDNNGIRPRACGDAFRGNATIPRKLNNIKQRMHCQGESGGYLHEPSRQTTNAAGTNADCKRGKQSALRNPQRRISWGLFCKNLDKNWFRIGNARLRTEQSLNPQPTLFNTAILQGRR